MKKPEGFPEAGWYDHPTEVGYEKYWNGKFWTSKTRVFGEVGPAVTSIDEKYLGRFLFRSPIAQDGLFIAYVIVSILSAGIVFFQEISASSIAIAFLSLLPVTFLLFLWIYVLFLIILIPRRVVDKKRGLGKRQDLEIEVNVQSKSKHTKFALLTVLCLVVVSALGFQISNSLRQSEGDKWFEVQQKISRVIGEWNVAATPISEAIIKISNGEMTTQEARQVASNASSNFAVIHNKLSDACQSIPSYDLNASGIDGAYAKLYEALKVSCDLVPQESVEVLLLVNEQISPIGTQAKIDYHAQQIQDLIRKRKQALLIAIEAMQPYLNDVERETLKRLTDSL